MDKLILPARGSLPRAGYKLIFEKPNLYGFSLKIAVRNVAKRLPEWTIPVELNPPVTGCAIPRCEHSEGECLRCQYRVPIDTLGEWIFGTPGYQGNAVFEGGSENIVIYLPKEAPSEAVVLLRKAIEKIGGRR